MAKTKTKTKSSKKKVVEEKPRIECTKCNKPLIEDSFYLSNNDLYNVNKRFPICKTCLKKHFDFNDVESVKELLMQLNRPFLYTQWNSAVEELNNSGKKDILGVYLKIIYLNFKTLTWKDSQFGDVIALDKNNKKATQKSSDDSFVVTDQLMEKWGFGYTDYEIQCFERKYAQLKNNYQEKTAMHREALLTYIRYRVKEELATARGEVKDAKEWGQLAAKAAQDAKINPSQMSKSDLSDGLDTFGQLVRTVEQAIDIIPILPQFKEKPQDKVDFTLWCYINYVRDLKSLPPADYKDIYKFYEERKKEYEKKALEEQSDQEDEFDEVDE